MAILGAILGSFACCQAWRLRFKEILDYDLGSRSVCMDCGRRLTWRENIPIVSWVWQRGKCKKCGAKIGWMEIFSEVSLMVIFGIAGFVFARGLLGFSAGLAEKSIAEWAELAILLVFLTVAWILLVYDAKWQELPVFLLTILNGCAILDVILRIVGGDFGGLSSGEWVMEIWGMLFLPALYWMLSKVGKGKLVGDGDWILALAISLMLGNFYLSLVLLMLSNFLACAIMGPVALAKKQKRIPFGPFLVLGFVITYFTQGFWLSILSF